MSGPATTRSSGSQLPPPPAPTARDANPWPMPGQHAPHPIPWLRVLPPKSPAATGRPNAPAAPPTPPVELKSSPLRWVPVLIIGGMLVAVGSNALQSFRQGDFIGALLPLAVMGVIASGWLRGLRRDRR